MFMCLYRHLIVQDVAAMRSNESNYNNNILLDCVTVF